MLCNRNIVCGTVIVLMSFTALILANQRDGGVHLRFAPGMKTAQDKPVTITVSGTITDAKTGKPIAGADVRGYLVVWRHQGPDLFDKCPYKEIQSGQDGKYALTFTTPLTTSGPMKGKDEICIDVSAPEYETRPKFVRPPVTLDNTSYHGVDIALYRGKLIKGTVVDESNKPIEGVLVSVGQGLSGAWNYFSSLGKTYTNQSGRFELWCNANKEDAVASRTWLRISKRGYGVGFFWDFLDKQDMGNLRLARGGTIAGKVVDANGKGVAGCEVSVRDTYTEMDKAVTNSDGTYELRGIPGDPGLIAFYTQKNKRFMKIWGEVTVYARTNPEMNLRDVPQYKITAKEGKTVTGPDLVVAGEAGVSGKVVASQTTFGLKGLMVRLDYDWANMVEVDAEGRFHFLFVSPGKHRLTAYLPNNLRGDRGIGHMNITVQPGKSIKDVKIELEKLAEVRVQFLDANGNPLQGITAGATWRKNGDGFWTEGTQSDKDGRAVLHLYPDSKQFIRGFDRSERSLVAEGFEQVKPKAGQVIENVRITMVPTARIRGRLVIDGNAPLAEKLVFVRMHYADKIEQGKRIKTDSAGKFELHKLVPGIVSIEIKDDPLEHQGAIAEPIEIKPGESKDMGDFAMQTVKFQEISGRLLVSSTFSNLEGFKIRLDLEKWEPMVPTDAQGAFVLPKVSPGKHRLTAYLPFNLRTDRGAGHVEIDVKEGEDKTFQLQLETLATIHMRIEDESGKPLEGISAAAWWNKRHAGVFTEGTKSDKDGNATLYLYPDELQYVGAHDWDGKYRLKADKEIKFKAGDVKKNLRIIMVPASKTRS